MGSSISHVLVRDSSTLFLSTHTKSFSHTSLAGFPYSVIRFTITGKWAISFFLLICANCNVTCHRLGEFLGGVKTSSPQIAVYDVLVYDYNNRTYLLFNDMNNLLVYRSDVTGRYPLYRKWRPSILFPTAHPKGDLTYSCFVCSSPRPADGNSEFRGMLLIPEQSLFCVILFAQGQVPYLPIRFVCKQFSILNGVW